MRLEGKVALITGGARGQGAAESRLFAREGAKVVIADVLDADGMAVAAQINELGGDATYVHLDVSSEKRLAAGYRGHGFGLRQAGRAGEQRRHLARRARGGHQLGEQWDLSPGHQRQGRVPGNQAGHP